MNVLLLEDEPRSAERLASLPATVPAFAVAAGQPLLLGPVALQPQVQALGEVVVTGQRAAV